uniref:Cupin type-2 domain-containing protein n=1 Tax=Paramoeba aestuarina TaxID=180227 RepID=A0A7S4NW73_9EUKA|mmetsp:Transcript_29248/g.45220  ORF Transcript_29248/g.45220 Transcript_29248/m.45220 type:complete len:126 (+) Transcript_29248:35-412(+)
MSIVQDATSVPSFTDPNTKEQIQEVFGAKDDTLKSTSIARIIVPAGGFVKAHYHPVCEEVYYILRGKGKMTLDGETKDVGPNSVVGISAKVNHSMTVQEEIEMVVVCSPPWTPECSVFEEYNKDK